MKKNITLFLFMLVALVSFQMRADMWIIGAISPDGWDPSKGVAMTTTDNDVYTVDIDVTVTGNQYFGLTSKLGANKNDWSTILPYRYGGNKLVPFDTETVLTQNTDQSPYCNFAEAGTYTFTFKVSTKTLKVTKKSSIELPIFNGTIYVSKVSTGNIWAWDNDGNYAQNEWPGDDITTLPTKSVNGTEYYYLTYTHNSTSPGLIFNDGTNQTANITPEDGKVYTYSGGSTYAVSDPSGDTPDPGNNVYILGSLNGGVWSAYQGIPMTFDSEAKVYTASVEATGNEAGYNYFSFTTKLAAPTDTANQGWDAIGEYRFGSVALDDFPITSALLGTEIEVSEPGTAVAFKIPRGTYQLELNMETRKLIITGEMNEVVETGELYVIGEVNSNGWAANVGVKMNKISDNEFQATVACDGVNEGYNFFSFTKKLGENENDWNAIAAYRFGANTEEPFFITEEHFGNAVGLGPQGSTSAYKIAEGEYVLTVNLESSMLIVTLPTTPVIPGDINGDGIVNVSDVTELVNVILATAEKNDACDVNADGTITVSDVTALVNLIIQ